jgi:FdhD protein
MAVSEHPLLGLGYSRPVETRSFVRLTDDADTPAAADVAEEVPVALVYNARPHVVVMATPLDLEDLAVGFTLTERIVEGPNEIERVSVVRASHGAELQVQIPDARAARLAEHGRGLVSRTGCGLCGIETISEAMRVPTHVGTTLRIRRDALWRASAEMSARQELNATTHTIHAAGWALSDGTMRVVKEDVGRHNALDKVFGALARDGVDPATGFVVVTSRASYELVQKAATCGVELLAAISRPTGLAIRFAESAGVTLVGLLRGKTANVYAGMERLRDDGLRDDGTTG